MNKLFIHLFLASCMMGITNHLLAQNQVWASWDEEVVRTLHTAANHQSLSDEEQKVILFMNMARHDGPLFARTFLEAYLEEKGMKKNGYVRSLFRDLRKSKGLPPLLPEADLTAIALEHARNTGESGQTGHQNFNNRFEKVLGNPYSRVAENLSYGHREAIDIVMSLLIDEGIRNLGHRKNILHPQFNAVGVVIHSHERYRVQCVIDFGANPQSDLNVVPYQ
jgi:hypothetical protein